MIPTIADIKFTRAWRSGNIALTIAIAQKETMKSKSNATKLFARCIDQSGKSHEKIALEGGFSATADIALIRDGEIALPIAMVGPFAKSVGADPVEILSACLNEYFPDTWECVGPFLESAFTADELSLVKGLREAVGGPYLTSLTQAERVPFNDFLTRLGSRNTVH